MVFGDDRSEKIVIWVLRVCFILSVFIGSLVGSGIVWTLGDIGVGIMAWINVVAILLLSPQAIRTLKDYEQQRREGRNPVFHPRKLGITRSEYWEE